MNLRSLYMEMEMRFCVTSSVEAMHQAFFIVHYFILLKATSVAVIVLVDLHCVLMRMIYRLESRVSRLKQTIAPSSVYVSPKQ